MPSDAAQGSHSTDMIRKNAFLATLSVILFGAGFTLLLLWEKIFDIIIGTQFVLKPDNHLFGMWQKTPIALNLDLYMWNLTNPEDIHNSSAKLKFEQIGPYRYREIKEKVNITWNDWNDTVSFQHKKRFFFDAEGSSGNLNDMITTINPIAVSLSHQAKSWGFGAKAGISIAMNLAMSDLYIKKRVKEILFDGYEDFFLNVAKSVPFFAGSNMPLLNKFAWFYERNGSSSFEGTFNMETGNDNTLGKLKTWNYFNQTPYFNDSCGDVVGSAGELFPSHQKRDKLQFFSTDLCRNVVLDYEEDIYVNGINAYKFAGSNSMLDNGTTVPENLCYCNGECPPYGIMNISSCRYGTPAFVSLPHFYKADPVVLENIEGLNPQKEKHDFYIALEPKTGLALQVSARLQLNLLLEPIKNIGLFSDTPKLFFPVLWFEQTVAMPESMTFMIKILMKLPYIFLSVGIFLLVLSMFTAVFVLKKSFRIFKNKKNVECKKVLTSEELPLKTNPK